MENPEIFRAKLKKSGSIKNLFLKLSILSWQWTSSKKLPKLPKLLKDGAEVLTKPICDIINLSIKLCTFQGKCKIARLIRLFEKGLKTDPKNYRPISLLSLLSKLIEKATCTQTQEYLDKHSLLYKFQSDFRKNFFNWCQSSSTKWLYYKRYAQRATY